MVAERILVSTTSRMRAARCAAIVRTVAPSGGSTAAAAKMLGISVRKVQYRFKEYRLINHLPP